MANRRTSLSKQELSLPAQQREMDQANETAQKSLGTPRKDWMNTSVPPHPQSHGTSSTGSGPLNSTSPGFGNSKKAENASNTTKLSHVDARQAPKSNRPPSIPGRSPFETPTKNNGRALNTVTPSARGSKTLHRSDGTSKTTPVSSNTIILPGQKEPVDASARKLMPHDSESPERTAAIGTLGPQTTTLQPSVHSIGHITSSNMPAEQTRERMIAAAGDILNPSLPDFTRKSSNNQTSEATLFRGSAENATSITGDTQSEPPRRAISVLTIDSSDEETVIPNSLPATQKAKENPIRHPTPRLFTTIATRYEDVVIPQYGPQTFLPRASINNSPIPARQHPPIDHKNVQVQSSGNLTTSLVPIPPVSSQLSPNPTEQGSQVNTTFDHGIQILSLQQFINANNLRPGSLWEDLCTRLQHRHNYFRETAHNLTLQRQHAIMQQLKRFFRASKSGDFRYLLLYQTAVILRMPWSKNVPFDKPLAEGGAILHRIFGDVDEANMTWCLSFPCLYPADLASLHQWFKTLSTDIIAVGNIVGGLSRTCFTFNRLPVMADIDSDLGDSDVLRIAVFESFLAYWWVPPRDDCYAEALRHFVKGLEKKRQILSTRPAALHHAELAELRRIVDSSVAMCFSAHNTHPRSVPTSEPAEVTAHTPQVSDHSMSGVVAAPPQTYSPSIMLSSTSRSPSQVQHPVSAQHVTPQQSDGGRGSLRQAPRSAVVPVQHMQNTTGYEQNAMTIVPSTGPGVAMNPAALAFPVQATAPCVSEYGPPIHHAHLRDALAIVIPCGREFGGYRSYISNSFVSKPMTFTAGVVFQRKEFVLTESTLLNFPAEELNQLGGRPMREIRAGNTIVRLRGANIGRPKTFSEWYVTETCWPSSIAVVLNGAAIEFRRKPQYPKDLAVDVTSRLKQGTNTIEVAFLWSEAPPANFQYTIALETATIANTKDLTKEIRSSEQGNTEEQLKQYFAQPSDDEVEMMLDHVDITLQDPITSRWPITPIRTTSCVHFQCFDLDSFLESMPKDINKADRFLCPICSKDARPMNLRIDGWMKGVLQKLKDNNKEDSTMIRVMPDLTWTVKTGAQISMADDDRDMQDSPSATTSGRIEVIELD